MPTVRNGETYYYLGEAAQVFGVGVNTLLFWVNSGKVKSYQGSALDIFIEEQSLRACIARHKGEKK